MTNCPNCSAPLPPTGKCEYCGSFFGEHQYIVEMRGLPEMDVDELIEITSLADTRRRYIRSHFAVNGF